MDRNAQKQHIPEVMEKGMQHAHGITHEEYVNDLDKKIEVEKAREEDYRKNKELQKQLNNNIPK
ncbi:MULTISPECIES: hypothetical protein [Alkalihalophilus]|uniref:Uncharacterized protein n=3 Tax=Alkalihalophilus TaxID=2893060 RepID=D3FPZ5_ALKPO|nr:MULTISPECIES: hypothetical protein [Alkalihalophilus]ADC51288.1 hypothetical protein BpOF4_16195 [Alkalihalophilus pseudofirmus OF4]ERN54374.1 hypothetical protein A33I_08115 [Alkalihalophilus marmarensis DSM 21297]MCM3488253.1 hypothetical protein [Alkalihalophilus marmarensis]MDV2884476.1 hypothetical protein [Alkalihalophilus pseudofirmus]MEC2070964.1 hypothetical protein [Alkalihalophilus marmarensis]